MSVTLKKPDFLLLFIIAVGAALRFYGYPHIPFMYDEVSAWARTGFHSFEELIQKGVKGDGHPAGIQVFLNYWRMAAGDSEAAFKLPFLVMGLLSILMVFKTGKLWFNETVGYLSAALVATLQYTVMYSQICRPYVSGLFFTLMMVWYWSNYLLPAEAKGRNRLLPGYIVFAALSCYNHYFSLLFAFIVGVTGLFLVKQENLKQYLIANVLIVMLFVPHLGITIYQLGIGGVGGWLPKPGPDFFRNYLDYVFQFSWWMKGLIMIIILSGFVFSTSLQKNQFRLRLVALCWLMIPFLTGYFYSVYRNAVLQYSVLIFSFPYMLFFIFSSYRALAPRYNWMLVIVIFCVGIYGLAVERDHDTVFYRQPVEELVKNTLATASLVKGKEITVLMNEPRKYAGYYLRKYHEEIDMDIWNEKDFKSYISFRNYLSSLNSEVFIAANVPTDYLLLVRQYYPYEIASDKGFTYQYKAFAKHHDFADVAGDLVFSDSLQPDTLSSCFACDTSQVVTDSITRRWKFHFTAAHEFGPAFQCALLPLITNGYNVVNVSMQVSGISDSNKASLVVSFDEESENVFWQEKPFHYFIDRHEQEGTVFYSISLRDLGFPINSKHTISAYIWNRNKDDFYLTDFRVSIDSGNPLIYGLIERL